MCVSHAVGAFFLSNNLNFKELGKRALMCQANIHRTVGIETTLAIVFKIASIVLLDDFHVIHKRLRT